MMMLIKASNKSVTTNAELLRPLEYLAVKEGRIVFIEAPP